MNVFSKFQTNPIIARLSIEQAYFQYASATENQRVADAIHQELVQLGVCFEGKRLPVSLRPTIVSAAEIETVARELGVVRELLNRILIQFVADLRENRQEAPLLKFFDFYSRWFELIAQETRSSDHIMLMRYDAIRSDNGEIKVMETNGACPGGVIHCAYIRDAWRKTEFGTSVLGSIMTVEHVCDDPNGFLKLLYDVNPNDGTPTIALCNYKGVYTNELASLARRNELIRSKGLLNGHVIVCDIRDIEIVDGRATVDGRPIDVVYNKIDPMMIDPSDPEISAWIAASRLRNCEFLNSFAALYIGEAKSIFAALWDDEILAEIAATASEIEIVRRRVPKTRMMLGRPNSPSYSELSQDRHKLVAKADALTRGTGVYVGKLENSDGWGSALLNLSRTNAVIQDVLDVPQRETLVFSPEKPDGRVELEYWGIDLFYYGSTFAGTVGRAHQSIIFNVGSGGCEVPTFVVGQVGM